MGKGLGGGELAGVVCRFELRFQIRSGHLRALPRPCRAADSFWRGLLPLPCSPVQKERYIVGCGTPVPSRSRQFLETDSPGDNALCNTATLSRKSCPVDQPPPHLKKTEMTTFPRGRLDSGGSVPWTLVAILVLIPWTLVAQLIS